MSDAFFEAAFLGVKGAAPRGESRVVGAVGGGSPAEAFERLNAGVKGWKFVADGRVRGILREDLAWKFDSQREDRRVGFMDAKTSGRQFDARERSSRAIEPIDALSVGVDAHAVAVNGVFFVGTVLEVRGFKELRGRAARNEGAQRVFGEEEDELRGRP